jgi:hypothetical protein
MENEEELYGAGFPLLEKLKLLAEWAPLLARLQSIADAKTPHDQALAIVRTLKWAAGRSMTEVDDEALGHVEAVLATPEGKAALEWAVGKVTG